MQIENPWPVVAAVVAIAADQRGIARDRALVVVGEPALLPADFPRRGQRVLAVVDRVAFQRKHQGTRWAPALAALSEPAPDGSAWVWAAWADTEALTGGVVALLRHKLPEADARAHHAVALSLVPVDGGPAPGAGLTRGGAA
jgi:hypothetical protein